MVSNLCAFAELVLLRGQCSAAGRADVVLTDDQYFVAANDTQPRVEVFSKLVAARFAKRIISHFARHNSDYCIWITPMIVIGLCTAVRKKKGRRKSTVCCTKQTHFANMVQFAVPGKQ